MGADGGWVLEGGGGAQAVLHRQGSRPASTDFRLFVCASDLHLAARTLTAAARSITGCDATIAGLDLGSARRNDRLKRFGRVEVPAAAWFGGEKRRVRSTIRRWGLEQT